MHAMLTAATARPAFPISLLGPGTQPAPSVRPLRLVGDDEDHTGVLDELDRDGRVVPLSRRRPDLAQPPRSQLPADLGCPPARSRKRGILQDSRKPAGSE